MSRRFRFRPHIQRAVIPWLVIHDALLEQETTAERDPFSHSCFWGLCQWLDARCVEQIGTYDDTTSASEFLVSLADDLEHEIKTRTRPRDAATKVRFEALAKHVRARVDTYLQAPDDPVELLDVWAREVTACCYEDQPDTSVQAAIAGRLGQVETAVIAASGVPPDAVGSWRVHGLTRFPVNLRPANEAELTFGIALDDRSWRAAGYVLLHELISHAAQGPWITACDQPAPGDDFAEGWMDAVAYLVHAINVSGAGQTDALDVPHERKVAAAALHLERTEAGHFGAAGKRHGRKVAVELNELLLAGASAPADETFLRLSLQLNASSFAHAQRRKFVFGIETATELGQPVEKWVDDYRRTGDLDGLVETVLTFATTRAAGRSAFNNDSRDE